MKELIFRKQKVQDTARARLQNGTEELSRLTGEYYFLIELMFGRILAAVTPQFIIAVVSTRTRPTKTSLVAIDESGAVFLPAVRPDDLQKISDSLNLSAEATRRIQALASGDDTEIR